MKNLIKYFYRKFGYICVICNKKFLKGENFIDHLDEHNNFDSSFYDNMTSKTNELLDNKKTRKGSLIP